METNFWNKKVREITPYIPGEQPKKKMIKLNTNENPYPPTRLIKEALSGFDIEILRKYPDPNADELKNSIAGYYGVPKECVFVGNGSDEVLAFAFQAFFDKNIPVNFPDITYSFYPVYGKMFDVSFETVPLDDDFNINVEDYYDKNGGVVIANPNAPTGIYLEISEIKKLLQANKSRLVIADEAYIDFGGETCIPLTEEFDNLLVVQTLSKSRSLAGLRVGYAIGSKNLISGLERVRDCINSYTTDVLAQNLASVALNDGEWFEKTRARIIDSRNNFVNNLNRMGFITLPSSANFVFTSHEKISAVRLFELLRKKGILVRYFNSERINNFLRITIGTEDEMQQLTKALESIIIKEESNEKQ